MKDLDNFTYKQDVILLAKLFLLVGSIAAGVGAFIFWWALR